MARDLEDPYLSWRQRVNGASTSKGQEAPLDTESTIAAVMRTARETSPHHYSRLKPEPIDVIRSWGLLFNLGNAVKYIVRAGFKPGVDAVTDLRKAITYLEHEVKTLLAGKKDA